MIPAAIPLKPRPATLARAAGTKMPAWLPDALRNARISDAARADPPPCMKCGAPKTEPIGGDELKRQCRVCEHHFDLAEAIAELDAGPKP